VDQAMVHGDHDSAAREHADALDAGHVGHLPRPRAGGVHGHARVDVGLLAGARVAHPGAGNLVAVTMDGGDGVVGKDSPTALLDPVAHRPHRLPHVDVG